jgi:uncharacterized protein YndB with AHSA1/START domain
MDLKFTVSIHIARPPAEVFEAVADPEELSGYFTTGGARGRLETGATVMWAFHEFPGSFPVEVVEVVPNEKIVLDWEASDGADEDGSGGEGAGYQTRVTITFKALEDGRTLVTISEEGWRETDDGLKASYSNCMGWSQMLCAMKAWIEHDLNLRAGAYA